MANNQPVGGDEIDLFDVIETLWGGRVILAGFVLFAMAIGVVFLALNKSEYVTQARYEINLTPPFLGKNEIEADIFRTFFNANTFAGWKEGRPGTSLDVDLIDQKAIIDGASFEMPMEQRFVSFSDAHIKIKSKDIRLIFEVLDYFEFVGLEVSERYFAEGKREQSRFDKLEKQFFSELDPNVAVSTFERVVALSRYMDKAAKNPQMIRISRPLPPQRNNASTRMILAVAIILGGTSGAVFLLVRQAYRSRKLRLAGLEA